MSTSAPAQTTLSLTLDSGPGPVSGVLSGAGEPVAFRGWIELSALIEERRSASAAMGASRSTPG